MSESDPPTAKMVNGIKLAGEVLLLPGSSLLLDGKVKLGALHAGAGALFAVVLGVPGLAVAAANSYCLSVTGKNLVAALLQSERRGDGNLAAQVRQKVAGGFSLDEIQESISEDIEDIYVEGGYADGNSGFKL